jgi:opacity protein-like surface antigen
MKKIVLVLMALLMLAPVAAVAADYWILNAKGGVGFPLGELGENVNLSWDAGISARRGLDREISVGGSITYATMPYKVTSAAQPFSATVVNAEIAFAPYLPDLFIWPYVKAGVGLFMVKYSALEGTPPNYTSVGKDETAFGIILGGGATYPITNELGANVEIVYNQASVQGGQGDNYNFLTFNAGITYFMK